MKINKTCIIVSLMTLPLVLLAACNQPQTEQPATQAITEGITAGTESVQEETSNDQVDAAPYAKQLERYYTAITQRWDENAYQEQEMSALVAHCYEDNPLDNIGYALVDLDGDECEELIIGSTQDSLAFEIWSLKDEQPELIAQSGSCSRYYLQYSEEDGLWSVAWETENSAANHAVYYLQLADGKFTVSQGVVFNAVVNGNAPWFMTYDLDEDVSNDMSIDKDTAMAIVTAGKNLYAIAEYIPYSRYK